MLSTNGKDNSSDKYLLESVDIRIVQNVFFRVPISRLDTIVLHYQGVTLAFAFDPQVSVLHL